MVKENETMSIEKMKFWCQKVLPLTYDESLSYYEVLCKTNQKLNEVIDAINNMVEHQNDYTDLTNLPTIDDVTVIVDKTADDYGLATKEFVEDYVDGSVLEVISNRSF